MAESQCMRSRYHITVMFALALSFASAETGEYCLREKFEADCSGPLPTTASATALTAKFGMIVEGRILMRSAQYGRPHLGRCVQRHFHGFQGCVVDVLYTLDRLCSGRSQCSVDVFHTFGSLKPCSEIESFLKADFICVPAVAQCSSSMVTIRSPPTPEVGYISGVYPATTSGRCPTSTYELRAARGQRWNISLLDFAAAHAPTPSAVTGTGNGNAAEGDGSEWEPSGAVCRRYAVIREKLSVMEMASSSGYSDEMMVCGGTTDRQRTVFLSQTEIIRLEVQTNPDDDQTDLFLLQFTAFGCVEPERQPGTIFARKRPDVLTVTCNASGFEYQLHCTGNDWVGQQYNCSTIDGSWTPWAIIQQSWSSISGIVMVTALGVALGVCVGCSLLGLATLCQRRYRRRMMKLDEPLPAGDVPYVGADGRLVDRSRTPTSTGRSLKDGGTSSKAYGDLHGRNMSGVMYGQQCPAAGQFESTAGQWCNHAKHWHRTTSLHAPPEVALRQRSDYSAAGDRNYFCDVGGTGNNGEFTAFVDWDATGNDVMSVGRCHGDDSCANVASEHVYEMAA